ncbi:hypothetical protein LPJ62_003154 [Coemansia sp. RSA 2167]|nr:hypothetical protein LPJ69_001382 [Coemansia sp. RSA 1752]KAJ1787882.1 hypothetical protein LPJ62_003154 [Coemansia sp. RSA 2167]KAJ2439604.1 hypothetical protein IWW46_004367 [Coemansia sp. RSA 2440]KAJ2555819.1 hypothetical protein IWW35_000408 [Coemansia sp. RSA 1878]
MEYQETKKTKLAFKSNKRKASSGSDKPKRKSKSSLHRSKPIVDSTPSRTWVPISSESDLSGPLVFYHSDTTIHTLSLSSLDSSSLIAFYPQPSATIEDVEPSRVEQVFVGRVSVPGNNDINARRSFKSCRGLYVSAGQDGSVECGAAAIGALEMWTPVLVQDCEQKGAVALKMCLPGSDDVRYLSIAAHDPNEPGTHVEANAHATSIGPRQTFIAKHQANRSLQT